MGDWSCLQHPPPVTSCDHFKQNSVYPSISQDCGRTGPGAGPVGSGEKGRTSSPPLSNGAQQLIPAGEREMGLTFCFLHLECGESRVFIFLLL